MSARLHDIISDQIVLMNKNKKVNFDDLHFLETALDIVLSCQRTLKNTYIFGYYMQNTSYSSDEKSSKIVKVKTLFEYQQKLLEDNVQKLLELLEDNSINTLIDCDNSKDFNKEFANFKGKIINLYKATEKFQLNLEEEIEHKMVVYIAYSLI